MATGSRRTRPSVDFWPGYVDGLAGLLMMMLFLLLFYVLGELIYSTALDSSREDVRNKSNVITDLLDQLTIAEDNNTRLEEQIFNQRQELQNLLKIQDDKNQEIQNLLKNQDDQKQEIAALSKKSDAQDARIRDQEEQLGLLNVALEQKRARLEETALELEKSQESLEISQQQLAALIAERDALKVTLAEAKQSLSETITTQAERIILLENSLNKAEALAKEQRDKIASLSGEQVLLVGRIEDFEALEQQRLSTLAALNADIAALQALREELQDKLSTQAIDLEEKDQSLLQSLAEMKLLNKQIGALNSQLEEVNNILAVREKVIAKQNLSLENLGQRLNTALASEVQRLQRYRSDFFEQMGEILANRAGIKVVDDRFILQSEVLFPSSSAELSDNGREQLAGIAKILLEVLEEAPQDLPWIIRVDGHTDTRPINTAQFPSNWELSSARAIAVVRYLRTLGIPETRLAATGFAHMHPIEDRDDEIAHRRNRRIEMKLTQR